MIVSLTSICAFAWGTSSSSSTSISGFNCTAYVDGISDDYCYASAAVKSTTGSGVIGIYVSIATNYADGTLDFAYATNGYGEMMSPGDAHDQYVYATINSGKIVNSFETQEMVAKNATNEEFSRSYTATRGFEF